jgi:hypothetical protein
MTTKRNRHPDTMSTGGKDELVFVVDVTSFTKRGYAGSTSYEGNEIRLEFDEDGDGVFLKSEMAERIGARRGLSLSVVVEDDSTTVADVKYAGAGKSVRISDPKVYYAIGREGGAIIRIRSPESKEDAHVGPDIPNSH